MTSLAHNGEAAGYGELSIASPCLRDRAALDNMAGQFYSPCRRVRTELIIEQKTERRLADLAHGNVNGSHWRVAKSGLRKIVHADDGNVLWDFQTRADKSAHGASSKTVARCQDGCKIEPAVTNAFFDDLSRQLWQPVVDLDHQIVDILCASRKHGVAPPLKAPFDGAPSAPGEERYPAVAQTLKIFRPHARRRPVAGRDTRKAHKRVVAIDQDNGLFKTPSQRKYLVIIDTQEEETRNTFILPDVPKRRRTCFSLANRLGYHFHALRIGASMQTFENLGRELIANIVNHGDTAGSQDNLTPSHRCWNRIVQRPGDIHNRRAYFRFDTLFTRQRARDRAQGNAATCCNILKSHLSAGFASFAHKSPLSSNVTQFCKKFSYCAIFFHMQNNFYSHRRVNDKNKMALHGRGWKMLPEESTLNACLDSLVSGMTNLRHDGQFDEPNLDGTPGDYISFKSWEWPQGVGLYGLVRLWMHNRDPKLLTLIEDWYDERIAAGLPGLNINTTAPMLALSLLWRETKEPRWQPVLDQWADRVINEMPRTEEGGLPHIVSDKINDHELWDDTLVMVGLFLASYGHASGRTELVDEACHQFLLHTRYLSDPKSGLWYHGWTFDGRHNFAGALWARGNSWITLGILDLVELAEIPNPVRSFLLGVVETQINALLKTQADSGAWHTLLDDPSSYEEISATAGIGYGLLKAARRGLGPKGCREAGIKALAAVLKNIDENGTVSNVSYGTRMGHDLQFYRDIPIQPTGYGQALAILCLAEGLLHTKHKEEAA